MHHQRVSRRLFIRDTAATAAVTAAGATIVAAPDSAQAAAEEVAAEVKKTRSYHPDMEYRRLGKTGLWVSAVCLGGHWKRIDKVIPADGPLDAYNAPGEDLMGPFLKNRYDVVSRCIEVGINLIDLAGDSEPEVYYKVLEGRRDAMYLAYSHPRSELRPPENRQADKLLELFKAGLKRCHVEYADIWRLMALERGGRHSEADVEAMITALDKARQQGLCRFTGLSTHDRTWAKMLMETYPDIVQMICVPYTSNTKTLPEDSMLDTARKLDVGILGIKPFASNSLFKGDGSPDGPHVEEDNRIARMALRYILGNPAITAPIPGLISPAQVDNAARAVKERRQLDLAEQAELQQASQRAWACLPGNYQWLKDWEYV
ncbi:MAG: aldo/keto reductase [Pirellulaceae bacterium]|nr:aldo/keto reductase [Pirellulaceae bacterium]